MFHYTHVLSYLLQEAEIYYNDFQGSIAKMRHLDNVYQEIIYHDIIRTPLIRMITAKPFTLELPDTTTIKACVLSNKDFTSTTIQHLGEFLDGVSVHISNESGKSLILSAPSNNISCCFKWCCYYFVTQRHKQTVLRTV